MTVETIEKDYRKKVERNRKSREAHIEAYYLGMISAIVMNEVALKVTGIESVKELVVNNMVRNGHEDKVQEALSYITPEKLQAAIPILAYRCFDYYDIREKEMKEAYDRQILNVTEAKPKAKKKTSPKVEAGNRKPVPKVEPQKKKYVVKIHKK